jgi:hypothetical protein
MAIWGRVCHVFDEVSFDWMPHLMARHGFQPRFMTWACHALTGHHCLSWQLSCSGFYKFSACYAVCELKVKTMVPYQGLPNASGLGLILMFKELRDLIML